MTRQSGYFLQALWETGAGKEKVLALGKASICYEIHKSLEGVQHPETVFVSEPSKTAYKEICLLEERIQKAEQPYQLADISADLQQLIGRIQAMQITTVQSLTSPFGSSLQDIHIIVRQLYGLALTKLKEQAEYQLYRILLLDGALGIDKDPYPKNGSVKEWITYYKYTLYPRIEQLDDRVLDARWAYERERVSINRVLRIEQFISVVPKQEELCLALGSSAIGTGDTGKLRIYGRGCLTNITPHEILDCFENDHHKNISMIEDYSAISDENAPPGDNLEKLLPQQKYIVFPEEYFQMINQYMLAKTFYQRIKLGNCLLCGTPLHHHLCPNCEGGSWII